MRFERRWWAVATIFAAGCTVMVDETLRDEPSPAIHHDTGVGGATGGGTPWVGSGPGGVPACGEIEAPVTPLPCPAGCTGGCLEGVCIVDCRGEERCKDAVLQCPPGFDCRVRCASRHACEGAEVACPPARRCEVDCEGEHACKDAVVMGGDGPVVLACAGHEKVCEKLSLACGPSSCDATCDDEVDDDDLPELACGDACRCSPCED